MPIISSSYEVGTSQVDGRSYVDELHVAADGQSFRFEYLWNPRDGSDPRVVMQLRAQRIDQQLATVEASQQIVDAGLMPVSYEYFRRLFSSSEIVAVDKVDASIDTFDLEQAQVDQHRSTVKQITSTGVVYLKDPAIRTLLEVYEQVGVLTRERVDEILNADGSNAPDTPPKVSIEATGKV